MFGFLINPNKFNKFSDTIFKPLVVIASLTLILGLVLVYFSPLDYQQGLTVKIMYIHVPSAWLALLTYAIMSIYSIIGLAFNEGLLVEIFLKSVPFSNQDLGAGAPHNVCLCGSFKSQ